MKLTLLCNAGFALECNNEILLVDVPNGIQPPFLTLPEAVWQDILQRKPPYDRVCGFWFTHDHPDHFDRSRVEEYHRRWPKIPIFLPDLYPASGRIRMGGFSIRYQRVDHAPIPNAPLHVVSLIEAGEKRLYVPADAVLDPAPHEAFLQGMRCNGAVWNPMFLSRSETRKLMSDTAAVNLICHLPPQRPDETGMWEKAEKNLERFAEELKSVQLQEGYPQTIEFA